MTWTAADLEEFAREEAAQAAIDTVEGPGIAAEDAVLAAVTKAYVAKHGLRALWNVTWAAKPCKPLTVLWRAGKLICTDCGKAFVPVGSAMLHAGDPRLKLLGKE